MASLIQNNLLNWDHSNKILFDILYMKLWSMWTLTCLKSYLKKQKNLDHIKNMPEYQIFNGHKTRTNVNVQHL